MTVRMGEVESVERQRDRGSADDGVPRYGRKAARARRTSRRALEDTVRKALSIGSFTAADEYAGLADASLMAVDPPDLELYFPWDSRRRRRDGACSARRGCCARARRADRELRRCDRVERRRPSRVRELARLRRQLSDEQSFDELQRRREVERARSSATTGTVSRRPEELDSPESVGKSRHGARLRASTRVRLSTRVVPVIYPPELAKRAVRPSHRGDSRHGSVPARVVPARRRGQASAAELRRHHRGSVDPARARRARRSTAKASRRSAASSSRRRAARLRRCRATPRAASACRRPATRAASTTCSCVRRRARSQS